MFVALIVFSFALVMVYSKIDIFIFPAAAVSGKARYNPVSHEAVSWIFFQCRVAPKTYGRVGSPIWTWQDPAMLIPVNIFFSLKCVLCS